MAHSPLSPRILSQPCDVYWAGFKSNTFALQQAGWGIAVEQDFVDGRIRLLINNADWNLYAFSNFDSCDYFGIGYEVRREHPVFHIRHCSPRIQVTNVMDDFSNFRQVDAMPQYTSAEIKNIEDFGIFAVPMTRTEEIIVEPADVYTLLEQIKKMQSPEQAEIRERNRRRDREGASTVSQRQNFHAQIISLEDYRNAA